jgi:hypothetical protein
MKVLLSNIQDSVGRRFRLPLLIYVLLLTVFAKGLDASFLLAQSFHTLITVSQQVRCFRRLLGS